LIEFQNLIVEQGDFTLTLPHLTLTRGDFVCILGNNGSGKSTFVLLLSGLKDFRGQYRIEGKIFRNIPLRLRSRLISLLPQSITLNMPFDVFYVILTGRFPFVQEGRYCQNDIERTEQVMKDFDIAHLRDRQFNELSGGEKQRVLLARTLNRDSPVIVLDEPLSGIDMKHQQQAIRYLKALQGDRIIIVVLHDISLALQEFDRFLFFINGSLAYDLQGSMIKEENLSEVFGVKLNILQHNRRLFVYL
jgi:ABC-type cobalamin/Fe3+-siderophores transport system ATPase subunit